MRTEKRLDECYKKAEIIEINDDSKIIMFSDSHRGDNGVSDIFAHNKDVFYHALYQYYKKGYTYIELGDGDELWENPRADIIISSHSDIFLLLHRFYKKNRFRMIYGNHNKCVGNDKWLRKNLYEMKDDFLEIQGELFPEMVVPESLVLRYKKTGQEMLLVHGQQGDTFNDELWPVSMLMVRYFWRYLHVIGFQNPASPSKNRNIRHRLERNYSKWIKKRKIGIICGHTHRMRLSKSSEIPYFNTGCCVHPRGISGIEITNGCISLVEWYMGANKEGIIQVHKKVIRKPIAIEDYEGIEKEIR